MFHNTYFIITNTFSWFEGVLFSLTLGICIEMESVEIEESRTIFTVFHRDALFYMQISHILQELTARKAVPQFPL